MTWLDEFESDIFALADSSIPIPSMENLSQSWGNWFEKAQGDDGYLRRDIPQDLWDELDNVGNPLGLLFIEEEKRKIPILLRLTSLYERLVDATEEDWKIYMRMLQRAQNANLRHHWTEFVEQSNKHQRESEKETREFDARVRALGEARNSMQTTI